MWQNLRNVGDAEFVSVDDKDKHVRIARRGDTVHINVDDQTGENEKVRIEIPVEAAAEWRATACCVRWPRPGNWTRTWTRHAVPLLEK